MNMPSSIAACGVHEEGKASTITGKVLYLAFKNVVVLLLLDLYAMPCAFTSAFGRTDIGLNIISVFIVPPFLASHDNCRLRKRCVTFLSFSISSSLFLKQKMYTAVFFGMVCWCWVYLGTLYRQTIHSLPLLFLYALGDHGIVLVWLPSS